MDSRHFDVVVVGSSISALMATSIAQGHNLRVALIAAGAGSFALETGSFNVPQAPSDADAQEFREAIQFFCEMCKAADYPIAGDLVSTRYLPTILGGFKQVALASSTLWNAEPRNGIKTAIVGIRELAFFDENFLAERLRESARQLGVECNYTGGQITIEPYASAPSSTLRIATKFDRDAAFRAEFASVLRHAAARCEHILVPAVLGLNSSAHLLARFQNAVGCTVSELPTLPPSIPGLRMFHRLWDFLQRAGVEIFQGLPVKDLEIVDDCCRAVEIASPGHPMILRGECVVLADNADFLTAAGELQNRFKAQNVYVTESLSSGRPAKSGDVMEILAGYRAGMWSAARKERHATR